MINGNIMNSVATPESVIFTRNGAPKLAKMPKMSGLFLWCCRSQKHMSGVHFRATEELFMTLIT